MASTIPGERFANLTQITPRSTDQTTSVSNKPLFNAKKNSLYTQDSSKGSAVGQSGLAEFVSGRISSADVLPVTPTAEASQSERDAIMTELCPYIGGNAEFSKKVCVVEDQASMLALIPTTKSLPRVIASCSCFQQYSKYYTNSTNPKEPVTDKEPTVEEKDEQRKRHFYNDVLLPDLLKEFKENKKAEVPTQYYSERFLEMLNIDNGNDVGLIAQLERCVLDLITCRPTPPTPTLYPGELHLLPLPQVGSPTSTIFAVTKPITAIDLDDEHSINFVRLLEKAVQEKLLSRHVTEIMRALQPPTLMDGALQCLRYHWTSQRFSYLREKLNGTSSFDANGSLNCRANLLYLFEFLLSENRNKATSTVIKLLPCDPENTTSMLEYSMLTSNFAAVMEKNKDLASQFIIHLHSIKHFVAGDVDECNAVAAQEKNCRICMSESKNFYDRFNICLNMLISYIFTLPTLYYRHTLDPIHLVSEPQCHVIMQLADHDHKSLCKDVTSNTNKPLLIGPNEFAVIVCSAVGPLLSATALDDRASSVESTTGWGVNQSTNSISSKSDMTMPSLSPNDRDDAVTPRGQKNTVVKHTTPKQMSCQINTPSAQEISPHHGVSPSRKLHYRSAQLFSLLVNNILLKRQRFHQPISSSHDPPTIVTEESLVELSSFALHFRSVAECTELYQTLKRFT